MIKTSELAEARRRIADRFSAQCSNGPQLRGLPDKTKACGQFLDEQASIQRGIHGTAAAIRVLGQDERTDSRDLVQQLTKYAQERRGIEQGLLQRDQQASLNERLDRDDANVIKVSELLFALHFVKGAVGDTEALRKQLADRLLDGVINGKGWGYFLDRSTLEPQLLPTAYAVRALAKHGYSVERQIEYIINALTTPSSGGAATRADINVRVFCLYVLSFNGTCERVEAKEKLHKEFLSTWQRLERLLDDDIEQNIEYSRDGDHHYVRVPWQLYLLALACKLAPKRAFASRAAQSRLKSIVQAVSNKEGFLYPHSGVRVSSRTNAILYDVLSVIEHQLDQTSGLLLAPAQVVDQLRSLLNSRWATRAGFCIGLLVTAVAVYRWHGHGGDLGDLAPELLAGITLLLFTAGKAR